MADFQPPEGLREIVAQALRVETRRGIRDGFGESYLTRLSNAVLAALFEACEVREERRIVIDDERGAGLPANGLWTVPPAMADTHKFLMGRYPSARSERRFVIETKPEPVSSTGEEKTDGR